MKLVTPCVRVPRVRRLGGTKACAVMSFEYVRRTRSVAGVLKRANGTDRCALPACRIERRAILDEAIMETTTINYT